MVICKNGSFARFWQNNHQSIYIYMERNCCQHGVGYRGYTHRKKFQSGKKDTLSFVTQDNKEKNGLCRIGTIVIMEIGISEYFKKEIKEYVKRFGKRNDDVNSAHILSKNYQNRDIIAFVEKNIAKRLFFRYNTIIAKIEVLL